MGSWLAGWHLSWQDPVALVLVGLGLVVGVWLHRRANACRGCSGGRPPSGLIPPSRLLRRISGRSC